MANNLAKLFGTNATPAVKEALRFIFETVPHPRGHCMIALPISARDTFDNWIAAHRQQWEQDFLKGKEEPSYSGIAVPDSACGFFGVVFRDNKDTQMDIQQFLKDMNLLGTENYLIIRKEKRAKLSANPLLRVSNGH